MKMKQSKISVGAEKIKKEADKLFNGLSAGGQIEMPIQDPWGSYFGMFETKKVWVDGGLWPKTKGTTIIKQLP